MNAIGMALIAIGMATSAFAGFVPSTPEISAGTATSAIALLAGACFIIWGRKKR
jgi:hypothetical protein